MELRVQRAQVSLTDLVTSVMLLGTAGFFAFTAWRGLKIGTPGAMGPGFFPLMIATLLAVLALVIGARAFSHAARPARVAGLRAFALVLGAPVAFALLIGPGGFILAIATSTLMACWSSRLMSWRFALLVTLGLTALSTGIFVYLLKMPVSLFGSWAGL
ncbi:tripartite tricarboxylate transporter TctB family protein [Bosea caraganae]|uniref:Tripartite tricarboxylate transporter TctB family protein n=1 Tax=Bosea caraganae TaxID=2763117 RepID=A0A370L6I6_9HYPH|nr:tripartite tricarboxylate transporter TctB family protein [Bosea caraganae]RDJ23151.1 tripartite tricarboxylate transporter TctB family protein [Bosea caraganae]RDJ24736.1 tripartite tricarboxylate transporter TctB family protein [Bosea caraganae]